MKVSGWIVLLAAKLGFSTPAVAHPHVFIDAKARFQFDETGRITALGITWVYDAFTSLTLLDLLDLDQDNDGQLSETDLARIVEAQTVWPDNFEGDTYFEASGETVALGRPVEGSAAMVDARIEVSFELPLLAPLSPDAGAELRLYDPTYYYAYSAIGVDAGNACKAKVTAFEPTGATSGLQAQLARLSREETPEQPDVGRLFADVIELTCA